MYKSKPEKELYWNFMRVPNKTKTKPKTKKKKKG